MLDFQLQDLTHAEEMLITAVLPILSIYRLPHGQYSYSGHVISLPQDVASFATSLPRLPSELDVVVVRKEGGVQSHRDFRVRRSVVLHALQWSVANNRKAALFSSVSEASLSLIRCSLAVLPSSVSVANL